MMALRTLSGRATTADGKPVPGMTIEAGMVKRQTDADGRYSIMLAPGPLTVYPKGGAILDDWFRLDFKVTDKSIVVNFVGPDTIETDHDIEVLSFVGTIKSIADRGITILSGTGAETLVGGAGDDTLDGRWAGDRIIGGGGRDVVLYPGKRAEYTITTADGVTKVAHPKAGTDTITGCEVLRFTDAEVQIAADPTPTPAPTPTPPDPAPVTISGYTVDAKAGTITFRGFGFPSFTLPLVALGSIYEKHIAGKVQ